MDNLCHSLVGATLAETGLRRRTRYATAALVLGANFPDLDIAFGFTGRAIGLRRGITHGIPALIVLPFVLTGLILLWHRWRSTPSETPTQPRQLLLLAAIAILTHPTLDWLNVYGMRWLMPFDGTWFYGDSLFILDPWLWLLLGAGWILGRRFRRRHAAPRGERFARVMVGLSVLYIAAMMTLSGVGRAVATRELRLRDPGPRHLMVAPPFLASWRREVTLGAGDGYRFGTVEWLPRPVVRLEAGELARQIELLDAVPNTVPLMDLLDWARFPFARQIGDSVRVDDARYARGGRSFAGVTILVPLRGPPAARAPSTR
jgi:inner membrane protein